MYAFSFCFLSFYVYDSASSMQKQYSNLYEISVSVLYWRCSVMRPWNIYPYFGILYSQQFLIISAKEKAFQCLTCQMSTYLYHCNSCYYSKEIGFHTWISCGTIQWAEGNRSVYTYNPVLILWNSPFMFLYDSMCALCCYGQYHRAVCSFFRNYVDFVCVSWTGESL